MYPTTDQNFLQQEQYLDASNLNARIALHRRYGTAKIDWQEWVFDQLSILPNARILKLGCGPGRLWSQNLDRLPHGWAITLSDFSEGMVEQAQQNLTPSARPFEFEQFDAQAIPFAENSFDAVIANHMLYHVPVRQQVYAEVKRVLRSGGRFFATTNSRNTMRQVAALETRVGIENGVKAFYAASDFTLENGEADLSPWFIDVVLHRQEETLLVTEAQPLIDYLESVVGEAGLAVETVNALQDILDAEITEYGAFKIDKISGMFVSENR